jgi:hypothetical protein
MASQKRTTTTARVVTTRRKGIGFKAWLLVIVSAAFTGIAVGRVIQVFIQPLGNVLSALLSR